MDSRTLCVGMRLGTLWGARSMVEAVRGRVRYVTGDSLRVDGIGEDKRRGREVTL
jgi:hypothetical protein